MESQTSVDGCQIVIGLIPSKFPRDEESYADLGVHAVNICHSTDQLVVLENYTVDGDLIITPINRGRLSRETFKAMYRELFASFVIRHFKACSKPMTQTLRVDVDALKSSPVIL